ncbi:hypothetical protein PIROE2DRAFT_3165 [Piromyces sp. E2]|nr:hypothetical protein PIROE2DRAFT_3165 [Piromyces sp. E2]|eukprot:OUM68938.1 hypothetical protein PIROE2DRAFT_3165 [Piromyces sp. E2]
MANESTNEGKKVMYILRGLPGSGKSTLAKSLIDKHNGRGVILSTDDFFIVNGTYIYDASKIVEAHKFNQNRCRENCLQGITPIIIDNTNVKRKEAKVYVDMAIQYGYDVQIREPDTPWWKRRNAKELAKRSVHNIPVEKIKKMMDRWDDNFSFENI